MSHAEQLRSKIESRQAKVAVIGLGYVGLPLLAAFHESGFPVLGFDIDPEKPVLLKKGENYLPHLGGDLCKQFVGSKKFDATTDPKRLSEADAIIVCVPTPLGQHGEPDLSYVVNTGIMIGANSNPSGGQLVVLESTSYPGTTRDDMMPAIIKEAAKKGVKLTLGDNLFVAFSPEREDPGRKSHSTTTIPKLVGGIDKVSGELATKLYTGPIKTVVPVSTAEVAEASKVFENVFRCVNIALVNELKTIMDAMGINVWEVIEAASTKPFGFMPFYPGPGLGGHCIPIDPLYLSWKARQYGKPTRFIELAAEINTSMPEYVVARLGEALSEHHGKALNGAKILILGLAYKKDVDDVRESPSVVLIELLQHRGAKVAYHDPFIPSGKPMREHNITNLKSVPLTPQTVKQYDAVLISTDHTDIDYAMVVKNAKLVVDSRNATAKVKGAKKNVVKA